MGPLAVAFVVHPPTGASFCGISLDDFFISSMVLVPTSSL